MKKTFLYLFIGNSFMLLLLSCEEKSHTPLNGELSIISFTDTVEAERGCRYYAQLNNKPAYANWDLEVVTKEGNNIAIPIKEQESASCYIDCEKITSQIRDTAAFTIIDSVEIKATFKANLIASISNEYGQSSDSKEIVFTVNNDITRFEVLKTECSNLILTYQTLGRNREISFLHMINNDTIDMYELTAYKDSIIIPNINNKDLNIFTLFVKNMLDETYSRITTYGKEDPPIIKSFKIKEIRKQDDSHSDITLTFKANQTNKYNLLYKSEYLFRTIDTLRSIETKDTIVTLSGINPNIANKFVLKATNTAGISVSDTIMYTLSPPIVKYLDIETEKEHDGLSDITFKIIAFYADELIFQTYKDNFRTVDKTFLLDKGETKITITGIDRTKVNYYKVTGISKNGKGKESFYLPTKTDEPSLEKTSVHPGV